MTPDPGTLLSRISEIVAEPLPQVEQLRKIAAVLRGAAGYRWVGLYDVDHRKGEKIVPILNDQGQVVGTIDVESGRPNAFYQKTEQLLEDCALLLHPLFAKIP